MKCIRRVFTLLACCPADSIPGALVLCPFILLGDICRHGSKKIFEARREPNGCLLDLAKRKSLTLSFQGQNRDPASSLKQQDTAPALSYASGMCLIFGYSICVILFEFEILERGMLL